MKIRIKVIKNFVFTAIFFSIATILPVTSVNADVVKRLYEVNIPVKGQSRKERAEVVREALKEILVRISGRSEASSLAEDETLVPRPTRFVQQFRYKKFKPDELIPGVNEGEKPYTQKLWLRFTERTVAKLLREQGLPVWGKTRPATLIWLVVDDKKQRVLVGNSSPHISRTHIEHEAMKRGLPFRLPLLDLADQSKLQVADVWGNFEDTILDASSRYQTEAVLVGRVYQGFSNSWNTRWSLYSEGQRQDWEANNAENLQLAVNEGLSKTGEVLSARFTQANVTEESDSILLQVKGVSNLKSYNKVMSYLKNLSVVADLQAYQMNASDVIFNINSRSGRLGIAQAISLGHVLVTEIKAPGVKSESDDSSSEQVKVDLIYKLVP